MIEHESMTCLANLIVTVVPLALLASRAKPAWGGALHWQYLVVLVITYTPTLGPRRRQTRESPGSLGGANHVAVHYDFVPAFAPG